MKYVLPMFPYPSGMLHLGHFRVYAISDLLARYYELRQYKVLHPIGWDSFGLPAENAAKQHAIAPSKWTLQNILEMRKQLKSMNLRFDWSREISTCDPKYYKFTQELFLLLYENGLVERRLSRVFWDPVDKTVVANEQIIDGRAERSGAKVEIRELMQYFAKITNYVSELYDTPNNWPKYVTRRQRNWINLRRVKCITGNVKFSDGILEFDCTLEGSMLDVIGIGPCHPLTTHLSDSLREKCAKLIMERNQSHNQTKGHDTGLYFEFQDRKVPIWIANFLLQQPEAMVAPKDEISKTFCEQNGIRRQKISIEQLQTSDTIAYSLRDWLISRQRSWGTPIPLIHCPNCKIVPVPREHLPFDEKQVKCFKCGSIATSETDTLDTFMDSSWYWMRYLDPHNEKEMCSDKLFQPVDIYVGGNEHAIMHLLYARFITKFLRDIKKIPKECNEPFDVLLTQGMVKNSTFTCPDTKRYLKPCEVENGIIKETRKKAIVTIEKMGKSKHNGVDPVSILDKYGTDAPRLLILYLAAPQDDLVWNETAITGMTRFLNRIELLSKSEFTNEKIDEKIVAGWISQITTNIEKFQFHISIGFLMQFSQALLKTPNYNQFQQFLILLMPFAPAIASRLSKIEPKWPIAKQENTTKIQPMINNKKQDILLDPKDVQELIQELKEHGYLKTEPKRIIYNRNKGILNILT